MQPDANIIDQLVERIVEVVNPLKIILFGSAARGEMGPDSDVDVLVVMPNGVHRRRTAQHLHIEMRGIPLPLIFWLQHLKILRDTKITSD